MASAATAPNFPTGTRLRWLARGIDWFATHDRSVLAIGIVFQVIFLLAMMVRPLITLTTGQTILLRVVPVDPRDIFRGDYVTLSYEINRPGWNPNDPGSANWENFQQKQGQPIYVLLEPEEDGKHWRSSGYQFEAPVEGTFIRGTVMGFGRIQFGIEQYFVQEGTGREYETAVREKMLSAEVALDKNGSAQIKQLIIE